MINPIKTVSNIIGKLREAPKSAYATTIIGLASLGILTSDSYEHAKSKYRKKIRENLSDSIADVYGKHMITGGNSHSLEKMKDWWRMRRLDSNGPMYMLTIAIPGLIATGLGELLRNILPLALIGGALFGGKIENKISNSSALKSLHNSPALVNAGQKLKGKFALLCAALIGLQAFKGFFIDVIGFGKENPIE